MYLKHLYLQNFRNLAEQSVLFSRGLNYLYGDNGAGKTAMLEAIHLLARGRSFRTQKIAPIINTGESSLLMRCQVLNEQDQPALLAMLKTRSGKTELRLNKRREARASALAKHLPIQTLLPDAADMLLGRPGERRAFLDWGVFHVEQGFVDVYRNYRRILMQRNAWLKSLGGREVAMSKDPWFSQLSSVAGVINEMRHNYVTRIRPFFESTLKNLDPEFEISIEYDWGGLIDCDMTEKKLGESWQRDVKFGKTHRGPHRADLRFTRNSQPAAELVSRGQSKLIASAAILAQAELLYGHSKTKSLFLIDDFGAELDTRHWRSFLETLMGLECQVIATSTETPEQVRGWLSKKEHFRVFHVEQGRIS